MIINQSINQLAGTYLAQTKLLARGGLNTLHIESNGDKARKKKVNSLVKAKTPNPKK